MSVTGKQIETGMAIMKLALEANRVGLSVRSVMTYAHQVAGLLTNTDRDQRTLSDVIVARMVTIRAEVK